MGETKLILIEGMPGSGKTTTCQNIGKYFQGEGLACKWYPETDKNHPIDCRHIKLKNLSRELPPLWRSFAEQILSQDFSAVVESRLWQNTALFMFMSEYPLTEIVEFHQLVCRELADLAPILIHLNQTDVGDAMKRLDQERDREILEKDIQFTSEYPWFQKRVLSNLAGWIEFFAEWQAVAEILFADFPYQKLSILNPHEDWAKANQQMVQSLKSA